jgi:transposase
MSPLAIGIDVAKDHLDLHLRPTGQGLRVPNTPAGHRDLLAQLPEPAAVARVILESTGGLERPVASVLAAAGYPVVICNARQIRDFAKALGYLAKTDTLDARVLAHFGEMVQPPVRPLPPPDLQELREFLDRRTQLVQTRTAEKNRLTTATLKAVQQDIEAHIRWLDKRIKTVDAGIDRLLATHVEWTAADDFLKSIPGIGRQVSRMLLGHLPELGHLDRRTLAALVGLAPVNRDSGRHQGQRHILGGRAAVRRALYMAAVAAIRSSEPFRVYYTTLRGRGKAAKVALIAVARKLLCVANAVLRDQTAWENPTLAGPENA